MSKISFDSDPFKIAERSFPYAKNKVKALFLEVDVNLNFQDKYFCSQSTNTKKMSDLISS